MKHFSRLMGQLCPISNLYKTKFSAMLAVTTLFMCLIAAFKAPAQTGAAVNMEEQQAQTITGVVVDTLGQPIEGATVLLPSEDEWILTDNEGKFSLPVTHAKGILEVSHLGYNTQELKYALNFSDVLVITLLRSINNLDEVVVVGYGQTTRRLNTGSVARITSRDISRQPVSNPLAALSGRITGLVVTQANGLPNSTFGVQIRGQNSLFSGTLPLFIIDGVPFMQNANLSQLSTSSINSPFNTINPGDIESIQVLKDADATAIYGSQGANGVILITTKKPTEGKLRLNANFYTGYGKITRGVALLNTKEYIEMRKEAFANDGIAITPSNAPDLTIWDTTRYTDWKSELIGGNAMNSNLQLGVSGGSSSVRYLINTNYNRQTTVFPKSSPANRATTYLNFAIDPRNSDLRINTTFSYAYDAQRMPYNDLARYILLPPNTPEVFDESGNVNWNDWPVGVDNPMAQLLRKYNSATQNIISNTTIEYQVRPWLNIKTSGGFNLMHLNEKRTMPINAQRPLETVTGNFDQNRAVVANWLIEPLITLNHSFSENNFEAVIGLSTQQRSQNHLWISALDYNDDDLLGDFSAAGRLVATNQQSDYKYLAGFTRLSYNYRDKYIANINVRRDGSSRFGPARRYATFGALGLAWILSEENFIRDHTSIISHLKLRGSYGVVGNDQVGDLSFLDSWRSPISSPYNGYAGILPTKLFNPYLEWERTRKFEVAMEIAGWEDRVFLSAAYYRNQSDNQLTGYPLPSQTGFTSIWDNMDALLENKGWEFELTSRNINSKYWSWNTTINLSLPKSRLVYYPGLENSSNRYMYEVGKPLESLFGYESLGIDDQTGVFTFKDVDGDGFILVGNDYVNMGAVNQDYYGGIQNTVSVGNFTLDFFLQFVKQTGRSHIATMMSLPGTLTNAPVSVLDRWQSEGDTPYFQRFATGNLHGAFTAFNNYKNSTSVLTDASFIRLKNLYIAYNLTHNLPKSLKMNNARLFIQGQNLLTVTPYEGVDPESQSLLAIAPLRTISVGFNINF